MTQRIPPRPRNTPLTSFYALGQSSYRGSQKYIRPPPAEPHTSANAFQRNPHPLQDTDIKPCAFRSSGFPPANSKSERILKEHVQQERITNMTSFKNIQSRAYAELADDKSHITGLTLTKQNFNKSVSGPSSHTRGIKDNWLYLTRQPLDSKPKNAHDISAVAPDWFRVRERPGNMNQDFHKTEGFDGTIAIVSRANGWITVTPTNKNRQKRIKGAAAFENGTRVKRMHDVSDLSPAWMQTQYKGERQTNFKRIVGGISLKNDSNRAFLIDSVQPEKSVFSFGDYRHNVMTGEEANRYQSAVAPLPKNFISWPEDTSRQGYDKPITSKIG